MTAEAPLWSGRPAWASVAVHVWKLRVAAVYFAVLLADGARLAVAGPVAPRTAWTGEAKLAVIAVVALSLLSLFAWLTVRTTRYQLDADGLTLRFGVALPATLAIPYRAVEHVGVRVHRDGTGDLALRLRPGMRVGYLKLWPHARPWAFARPEPMLRCIREPGVAAAIVCRRIAAAEPSDA